MASSSKLLR
ncbi:unnamed protein product [Linum tenue]|uniref:Uncharacterized protein n=1 Tax=Linum tenue TaxID=586396 RepID=A0AAV0P2K2_9ROSI|nr:unnamed protein product [Linum tenue]